MDDQQRAGEFLDAALGDFGAHDPQACEVYDRAIIAIIAALRAAPEGFVLVPVEPTRGMVHGLASALDYPSVYMGGPSESSVRKAKRLYATIISARPHAKP